MNTTDLSTDSSIISSCENNWSTYLNLGLNFLIGAISIVKQVLNSKSHSSSTSTLTTLIKSVSSSVNQNANQEKNKDNLETEQVNLTFPEDLKASVHEN